MSRVSTAALEMNEACAGRERVPQGVHGYRGHVWGAIVSLASVKKAWEGRAEEGAARGEKSRRYFSPHFKCVFVLHRGVRGEL